MARIISTVTTENNTTIRIIRMKYDDIIHMQGKGYHRFKGGYNYLIAINAKVYYNTEVHMPEQALFHTNTQANARKEVQRLLEILNG